MKHLNNRGQANMSKEMMFQIFNTFQTNELPLDRRRDEIEAG